eukprot:TRINITY_DN3811_c0_g1_i3.p1 TRINITY_DN3811_c0_g1~~TRINITY_DN3811_c0_g1_i3.p1  ORF type:complete len:413 (-),score=58.37 TRINITY_DN3811_c0_g1_i3:813-2015(-)
MQTLTLTKFQTLSLTTHSKRVLIKSPLQYLAYCRQAKGKVVCSARTPHSRSVASMPPRKRKAATSDDDGEQTKKATKTATKKTAKQTKNEPEEFENGWTLHWPNLIYKAGNDIPGNAKIAGFDFDGTLVNQKSSGRQPKDADDWKFFNKTVKKKLEEYQSEGYKLVIFTNQGSIKSKLDGVAAKKAMGRIDNVIAELGLDIQVLMSPGDDEYRKPNPGMFEFVVSNLNEGKEVNKKDSFYVGDMAGRPMDIEHSDSDKKFAQNIGITFKVPEDIFGAREGKQAAPTSTSGENLNPKLSKLFSDLARMGEAQGDNTFAIRAYRKVSGIMASYPKVITADNYKELKNVSGVGKNSLEKIGTYMTEGELPKLNEWLVAQGESLDQEENEEKEQQQADMASKFL